MTGHGFAKAESRGGTLIGGADGLLDDAQAVSIKAAVSRQRFLSFCIFEFLSEFGCFLGGFFFKGLIPFCGLFDAVKQTRIDLLDPSKIFSSFLGMCPLNLVDL